MGPGRSVAPKLYHVRSVGRQDALARLLSSGIGASMAWEAALQLRIPGASFSSHCTEKERVEEVEVCSPIRRQLEGCVSHTISSSCTHIWTILAIIDATSPHDAVYSMFSTGHKAHTTQQTSE